MDLIGGESLKTAVSVEHKAICCPYAERPSTIADVIQVKIDKRNYKRELHCVCVHTGGCGGCFFPYLQYYIRIDADIPLV